MSDIRHSPVAVPDFSETRVAVLGDIMLDRYVVGTAERVSPEAPVPVVRVTDEWVALGGAANVAVNCSELGAAVSLLGVIGEDSAGIECVRELSARGVATTGIVSTSSRPTTVKTRVMAENQHVTRVDRETDAEMDAELADRLLGALRNEISDLHALVLQDYNKGVLAGPVIAQAISMAQEHGVPVVVDPKRRRFFDYHGVTVFKPNLRELEDALGTSLHSGELGSLEEIRERLGCRSLVVTLGPRGMIACEEGQAPIAVPAFAQEVFDVSGAGDTVVSVMALATAVGESLELGMKLASHAAAVSVSHVGARPVSLTELRDHVRRFPEGVARSMS